MLSDGAIRAERNRDILLGSLFNAILKVSCQTKMFGNGKEQVKHMGKTNNTTGCNQYSVIYADPPWDICGQKSGRYGAVNHYELMTLEQIKAMPVGDISAPNAACFLWICNGMYQEGVDVLKSWGFRLVSDFIWIKPKIGLGNYFRYASEKLLLGVKGRMLPAIHSQPNWGFFPVQDHSHKPEEVHAIIERMYPEGKHLELFARRRPANPAWDCWGLECPGGSDVYIPGYPMPSYSPKVTPPAAMEIRTAQPLENTMSREEAKEHVSAT